ncbi:hypothetical protein AWM70_10900 [Paenibacillus yonginensis]|uniref:Uncharacterized protein n=1 Tax=Paenibacillus yonginensis TaxID=1462996 RepID=A0A1B1N0W2_9BACL|nr:hypothetical protein [Paenibacillus yonginensis]ANS75048.1 hypothetical protein AWM70_10900 [Paenibacillus yonginensis]
MSAQLNRSSVIYELHPDTVNSMKGVREQLHQCCGKYLNHDVSVRTMDGHVFEGNITALDGGHLYLSVAAQPSTQGPSPDKRALYYGHPRPPFYPYPYPYYNPGRVILPLVLYELLAVSLL